MADLTRPATPIPPVSASIGKSSSMSGFRPASSRTTLIPPSVSSLAAHEPDAPEPTTIASYLNSVPGMRASPGEFFPRIGDGRDAGGGFGHPGGFSRARAARLLIVAHVNVVHASLEVSTT